MRRCLPLLAVFAFTATVLAGPDERVAEIRKWYDTVQKAKPTAEKKVSFEAESEPLSGDVTWRDFDGGWKTVTVSYGAGDHGMIDEQFYFKDGTLFFAYIVETFWRFHPDSTDEKPKTIDTRTEDRYYYDGKKCIRSLTRSATSDEGEKLAATLAKVEQKEFDPAKDTERVSKVDPQRAGKFLAAKTAKEVLAAFGVE